MSLEVFLLIDNQLWGEKNGREGCEVVGRKWELIFPSYLESAGAWLLLLGCRVLVVCGHSEWISKDEAEKETKETSKPELNQNKQTNKQTATCCDLLPVPVCASVSRMARWAHYIRDAEGGPKLARRLACHRSWVLK